MSIPNSLSIPSLPLWQPVLSRFRCVWLFATLWTAAHQVPLSMGFSRQIYWSELQCPPPDNHKGTEYLESWRLYLSLSQCLQKGKTFSRSNLMPVGTGIKSSPVVLETVAVTLGRDRMHVQRSHLCHNAQKHGTPSVSWIENKESGSGWVPCRRGEPFTTFFLFVSFHVLLIQELCRNSMIIHVAPSVNPYLTQSEAVLRHGSRILLYSSPWWLSGNESASSERGLASIPGPERSPGGGNSNTLQYSCLGNSLDRSLVGYSP